MAEKIKQITKETLLPISLVLSIVTFAFMLGSQFQRISSLEEKNSPTRDEYTTMQADITVIKSDVKAILQSKTIYEVKK